MNITISSDEHIMNITISSDEHIMNITISSETEGVLDYHEQLLVHATTPLAL
jgi:aminopeptidase C